MQLTLAVRRNNNQTTKQTYYERHNLEVILVTNTWTVVVLLSPLNFGHSTR